MTRLATAAAALLMCACNALTGVDDFSTPSCVDCERKECAAQFNDCTADMVCSMVIMCLSSCSNAGCAMSCQPTAAGEGGAMPGPEADAGSALARDLISCGQVQCEVCQTR